MATSAGGWAFEETPLSPQSREAINRARAEEQWLSARREHVFRLPGIYGPGRSQLDRVREPNARRIVKPGQVFSRAHVSDIASALQTGDDEEIRPSTSSTSATTNQPRRTRCWSYAAQLLNHRTAASSCSHSKTPTSRQCRATLLRRVQARLERQGQRPRSAGARAFRPIARACWTAFRPSAPRRPDRRVASTVATMRAISCGRDSR
jgi:hypothetical protein